MKEFYQFLIISSGTYREISLSPDSEPCIRIGTMRGCSVRYLRDAFFDDFMLTLERTGASWTISCTDNVQITQDGVLKLQTLTLSHGANFRVLSQKNIELFQCSFLLDFDREQRSYSQAIDLKGIERLSIGGRGEHILLEDPYVGDDMITLVRDGRQWVLSSGQTRYGITHNGALARATVRLDNYDFFALVGYSFFLKDDVLYTSPMPGCQILLPHRELRESVNTLHYPKFNRSTRLHYLVPEEEIEVLAPPPRQTMEKKSILFSLIPSLIMLAMTVVLRGFLGSGGTFVIFSAVSMSVGMITSVITYVTDKRNMEAAEKKRIEAYQAYLTRKEAEIQTLRGRELHNLEETYLDTEETARQAAEFDERLFERDPEDADFLALYLGKGAIPAPNQIKVKEKEFKDEEDPLDGLDAELAKTYAQLPDAPVIATLRQDNSLGIVGDKKFRANALRQIALDLSARHYANEVKLFFLLPDEEAESFLSLRWLPHAWGEDSARRFFAGTQASRENLVEYLYALLSSREAMLQSEDENLPKPSPHLVVFIFGSLNFHKHPISRYFSKAGDLACSFLFFAGHKESLPQGCGEVVLAQEGNAPALVQSADAEIPLRYAAPTVTGETLDWVARRLAAVEIDEISLESQLTQNISLFEMLGIVATEDLNLQDRWNSSLVYKSMAAPMGVNRKNDIVYLDIGDKASAHGPHGLVAGTTGSGKSEILQTYILSIATLFHPYEVSFVIIDFKGGGMANQFEELPHLLGAITNIDGREIDRSLLSIKAELLRRQAMFAEAGVNHINDYIRKHRQGDVTTPLPHLIIIVDEFAELKSEFPDFMKELISAARIGRTLGVHLILATQKPSGVVDSQIWANSKFRLCLKVQNKEDSNEVLKSPLAAEIKEPGRAYFQVGNNEIFELFQSAYSGGPVPNVDNMKQNQFQLLEVSPFGEQMLRYSNRPEKGEESEQSQLQAVVSYVARHCREKQISHLPGICLPPLADGIVLRDLEQPPLQDGILRAIGFLDDPEQQLQAPYCVDLTAANTFIVGNAQAGKTTLLQTIAYALIDGYTPEDVNLYIIDCGNMALKPFEQSRHVGGVVLTTEEEKMLNLFKLLRGIVAQRRKLFSEKGVGTYAAYLEGGFEKIPQIVLLIDNIAAFREYYDELMDEILFFSREGLSVGISCVLTATQTNAISYKTQSNFTNRIALTCTETSEYSSLFGRVRMEPKPIPGRALIMSNKRVLECQLAQFGTAAREVDRVEQLRSFLAARNEHCLSRAKPIPMVPDFLKAEAMFKEESELFRKPELLPLGMDYRSIQYLTLDLVQSGTLSLLGPDKGTRLGFTRYVLEALKRQMLIRPLRLYLFDDSDAPLREYERFGFVEAYTTQPEEAAIHLEELAEELKGHRDDDAPLTILYFGSRSILQAIGANKELSALVAGLMKQAEESRSFLIFSGLDNAAPTYSAPEYLKQLRDLRHGLFFGNAAECKFYDISGKQVRDTKGELTAGDGFYLKGDSFSRVKTIQQNT